MNFKLRNPFSNPFVGPIVFTAIVVIWMFVFLIPEMSHKNEIEELENKAVVAVEKLRKLRDYYTINVVSKIKKNTDLIVTHDHKENDKAVPLPIILTRELSNVILSDGIKVTHFSRHLVAGHKDGIISKDQEEALQFLEQNPQKTYTKFIKEDDKNFFKVSTADVLYKQECVDCHNSRYDSLKNDWKLGDVGSMMEITFPYTGYISLKADQMIIVGAIFLILLIILSIHYTYFSVKEKKRSSAIEHELEDKVAARTKTLNEYKRAVDLSAIVSKTNKYGMINYVNEEFVKTSQYSEEELIGQNHNIVRHPDMPDEVFKDLWETIKAKKIWKGQMKNRAKDGSSYYVASTIVPLTNADDEIEEFLAIRLDITQIVKAKLQAEQADLTKSTFLANMSHEIRTPLNAIIGFSNILTNSLNLNIDEKKQASVIESSANSLLMIINDILDISKIESGNFQINMNSTDLYFITENVVELFTKRASEKNIKFVFNLDNKIPLCVHSDGTRLRQVISNLLSNSIKFTESFGTVYLNILILENMENKTTIRFEVIDTGIGIPKDKLGNIFQPFMQVDSQTNRKYEGTGLGLSICSNIIEAFNSKIYVESNEGDGSRFWFDITFDVCEEVMFEKSHYAHNLRFKVMNQQSDLYHFAKRYLNIFGKIDFDIEFNKADIIVCDYNKDFPDELNDLRKKSHSPKLVFFEYEKDYHSIALEKNEVGVCLPFYASKLNDAIQKLINESSDFPDASKETYNYKGNILIAEDNQANQELITFIMQSMGVDFDIASNGKEALNMFKNNRYDLVFMDINMPIMDGIEAFKQIREHESEVVDEHLIYIPIIALTANAVKGDKEKFLNLGMSDYLSKPIEMEKLSVIFDKYLPKNHKVKELSDSSSIDISNDILDEKEISQEKETEQTMQNSSRTQIILDPKAIGEKLGVSEDIGKLLISQVKGELPKDLEELESYINDENFDEIKNKAHYIKNSCLNLGLEEICKDIQQIETEIKDIVELKEKFAILKSDLLGMQ